MVGRLIEITSTFVDLHSESPIFRAYLGAMTPRGALGKEGDV